MLRVIKFGHFVSSFSIEFDHVLMELEKCVPVRDCEQCDF